MSKKLAKIAENWEFAKSPTKYPKRPVPEEFIDYMFVRIGKASNKDKSLKDSFWEEQLIKILINKNNEYLFIRSEKLKKTAVLLEHLLLWTL